ncbi:MAG: CDGSH iron-sulfur domain-containing protein [Elusimicrobiota bacterium]
MAQVTIQAMKNGPLIVKGEVSVLDSSGQEMRSAAQVALCRCGRSADKPFCDGAHRAAGFESVCVRQAPTA